MRYLHFMLIINYSIILFCQPALAHKVNVFAWVDGKTVHTESKFSGGKHVKDGKIEVYDHLDQKVLEGITDAQGYYGFTIPWEAKSLKIVLTAGMGHSNHWQITAAELGREPTDRKPVKEAVVPRHQRSPVAADAKEIEAIVERAVERKLIPIKAQLAEQAWGFRDIVAGIGYILGLMGLASYMHNRKKT
jgi:nickel transport protein